jgi:hypothetical protein
MDAQNPHVLWGIYLTLRFAADRLIKSKAPRNGREEVVSTFHTCLSLLYVRENILIDVVNRLFA